jgi:glycosyltransferase involved in cell wall biosynthesis
MRVAIVHNHPIHYKHLLFQELTHSRLDFEVLFLASQSTVRHEVIPLSPELYKFKIGYQGSYESAPAHTRVRFIWNSLRKSKPNVVVISGYYAVECWIAWIWARLNRRRAILWFESNEFDYPRSFPKESLKRLFLSACHSAHVYGTSNKNYLAKLGMRPERIHVKRAVVDVDRFSAGAHDKVYSQGPTKHLVYVGRLAPEKNVSMLLRCLSEAAKTRKNIGLNLSIIGTGPLEQELRAQCVTLGLQEVVAFKGYCPQKSLGSMLKTADFFVLPSTREPWGLVALEAMLCRIPVLVSTQCGCAEDVVTKETGWKFSPWNDNELKDLFLKLPDMTTEEIATMGSAAHELAAHYSPSECAKRVATSILECAEHVSYA